MTFTRSSAAHPPPDPERVQQALTAMHQRRARLRRARIVGLSSAGVVAAIIVAGLIASSSPSHDSIVVAGQGSTTTSTSSPGPADTTPSPPVPVALPALDQIPHAVPRYERRFPWGTSLGSVGGRPGNQSAPEGPLAFRADVGGNIVIFDVVNRRLVERLDGRTTTYAVDTRGFGPEPAVLDAQHRLITSDGRGGLVVFATDGTRLRHYPASDFPAIGGQNIPTLVTDGRDVYASPHNNGRVLLLHDDGAGYEPVRSATWEPDRIIVEVSRSPGYATIGRWDGSRYSLRAAWQIDALLASRLQPDGTIVTVVVAHVPSNDVAKDPATYYHLILAIDRSGHAALRQFQAPNSYMDPGPIYELTDTYFAVMSDTEQGGVTIAVYPYPKTPGE